MPAILESAKSRGVGRSSSLERWLKTVSFERLILRAVLRQVSPMVIRLVSVSDHMPLPEFHDVFRIILGWNGDLGYIIRVHGQEFNSFRRKMRSKALTSSSCTDRKSSSTSADTLDMGVGPSGLGYSGRGRRRLRADLRGRPRHYASGVLRGSNRLSPNAEEATRGCRNVRSRTAGGWCSEVGRGLPGSIRKFRNFRPGLRLRSRPLTVIWSKWLRRMEQSSPLSTEKFLPPLSFRPHLRTGSHTIFKTRSAGSQPLTYDILNVRNEDAPAPRSSLKERRIIQ
jgi:hypothetical protein